MKPKHPYLNFPLPLLKLLAATEDCDATLEVIFGFAAWYHVKKHKVSNIEIARYLHYKTIRDPYCLPEDISHHFDTGRDFSEGYDFFGAPPDDDEYEDIILRLKEEHDWLSLEELVRMARTEYLLGITISSTEGIIRDYNKCMRLLASEEEKFGPSPYSGVRVDVFFDTRKGKVPLDVFRLISAVSSLQGTKKYVTTNKKVLLSRMLGAKNATSLEDVLQYEMAFNLYSRYTKRYPFDKLLNQSADRGFFSKVPAGRGLYISTKLGPKEIAETVIKNKNTKDDKRRIETESREILMRHQAIRRGA